MQGRTVRKNISLEGIKMKAAETLQLLDSPQAAALMDGWNLFTRNI